MTIPATTPKVLYSGDDVTDEFPIPFIYWDASDIRAVVNIGGVETLWVLNTDYTLSGGNGATGTLTSTTPPATGTTLMIRSSRAAAQEVALPLGGPLPSTDIEQALDKVVRITQQLQEEVDRALRLQETSTDDGIAAAVALQESVDNFEANYESTIIAAATATTAASTATTQAGIATSAANSASADAAAAAISETNAGVSAGTASVGASAASASAAAAAGYLAPVTGTSTSSLLVGTGSKSLTIGTGLNFVPGHPVKIARTSDANNTHMTGVVTSYNAGTGAMVAEINTSAGSGTHTDWTVLLTPASVSTVASNLAGGSAGTLPYQSGANTTAMLSAGSAGQVLTSGGAGAPAWTSQSSLSVGSATNATNATNVTGATQSQGVIWSAKQTFDNTVKLDEVLERITITASSPVTNFDCLTQAIQLFLSNTSANWTLNFRGDGSNSLDSQMEVGESITVTVLATQSTTGYLPTIIQVDGSTVTAKYLGGTAWTADASCINAFTFTIIKAASALFTVLASKSKYA